METCKPKSHMLTQVQQKSYTVCSGNSTLFSIRKNGLSCFQWKLFSIFNNHTFVFNGKSLSSIIPIKNISPSKRAHDSPIENIIGFPMLLFLFVFNGCYFLGKIIKYFKMLSAVIFTQHVKLKRHQILGQEW